ncbi:MAG: quinoprotein relay system zinc metallohydrolase 2 [Paracoccaceae bacterium]
MFHLLVTACLASDPNICAERLLPAPDPLDLAACESGAVARLNEWGKTHGDLIPGHWRCVPVEELPVVPVREIAPGILLHNPLPAPISPANGGNIANLGVIIGTDSVAVIDPGGSRAIGEALFAAIRARSDKPIVAVIITHMHPDHSYGAEVFAEAGAEVIGHENLADGMARRAETWARSIPAQVGALAMLGTKQRLPDRGLTGPETMDLGGATLQLQPQGIAHTDNDLTVFHVESGTLFTGDLVFAGLLPSLDGSITGWLEWLAVPPQPALRQIVPGHGPAPLDWEQASGPMRAYLTTLADETRAAIAAGEPMSEAARHVGQGLRGDWIGFDDFNERNAVAAFKELEWE